VTKRAPNELPRWLGFLRPFGRIRSSALRSLAIGASGATLAGLTKVALGWWTLFPHAGPEVGGALYRWIESLAHLWWALLMVVQECWPGTFAGKPGIAASFARVALVTASFLVLQVPGQWLSWRLERRAFEDFTERSAALIDAIRAFEAREGEPPGSLDDLVPHDLQEVPTTGMRAYTDLDYVTGARAQEIAKSPWFLEVEVSGLPIFTDYLVYYPSGDYDPCWHGQPFTLREWAHARF